MNNNQLILNVTITLEGNIPISKVRQIVHQQGWSIEDAIAEFISNQLNANTQTSQGEWDLDIEIKEQAS